MNQGPACRGVLGRGSAIPGLGALLLTVLSPGNGCWGILPRALGKEMRLAAGEAAWLENL